MALLIVLLTGTLSARIAGFIGVDAFDGWPASLRVGLALMFVLSGAAHFSRARRRDFVAMVPPQLPRPDLLVTTTGILELAGAAGLLVNSTARPAAACLALLLLVMFPANVSAAKRRLTVNGRPATPLAIRTALQCVYVAAAAVAAIAS